MKRLLLLIMLSACGQETPSSLKEPMNSRNDPKSIPGSISEFEYILNKLPDTGYVERIWTGDWWPMSAGGTASRRYGSQSPMEKYDAVTTQRPLAYAWEVAASRSYSNIGWAGHCNGISSAGVMMEEPVRQVYYKNVLFNPIDVKALLTEMWQGSGYIVGDRCDKKAITYDQYGRINEAECRDVNPATFHIAVTNYIGLFGKAIIGDKDPSDAVWNYPIKSYNVLDKKWLTKYEANYMIRNYNDVYVYNSEAVDFVYIKNEVTFLNFNPINYEYVLELDQKGKILGGEWVNDSKKNHPDFLWRPQDPKAENPNIDLQVVNSIYRQSI